MMSSTREWRRPSAFSPKEASPQNVTGSRHERRKDKPSLLPLGTPLIKC